MSEEDTSQNQHILQYITKQTKPESSHLRENNTMKAFIFSHPPLGQVTTTDNSKVCFTASIEVDASRIDDDWQVAVWLSEGEDEWQAVPLARLTAAGQPILLGAVEKEHFSSSRVNFNGEVTVESRLQFTLRFRNSPDRPWIWVKDNQGSQDGTIILKTHTATVAAAKDLSDYIDNLHPSIHYENVASQTPNTTVWSCTLPVFGAQGKTSAYTKIKFGNPWHRNVLKYFCLVRIWTPWLCPRQGGEHFSVDKDAILCSFLDHHGRHLVLLAMSGIQDLLAVFQSNDEGDVLLNVRNDRESKGTAHVIVALGDEFELANAAAMYHARSIVTKYESQTGEQQAEIKAAQESTSPQDSGWTDGLTYCTWNGLGQRLTEEKIYQAVESLADSGINVENFIIDDNWQNLDYRGEGQFQHGWSTFEAEPKAFPNGLKDLTKNIRKKLPSIKHIGVWHALWGYWGGLDPSGEIAKAYKTVQAVREEGSRRYLPLGGAVTVVGREDVQKFYDDFYSFLSKSGVDAVKTDAQFMFDTLENADDRRELMTAYLDAWTVSSLKHFSIKAISCMSQTPQILFHSQLPSNRPPIMVRNSDDFFPQVPSSHPWHVWTNAHNALLTQHLNVLPDWDMFQTVHDYSGFHAAARCVSGGPIYITDVPGQHDINLINQMSGRTIKNKTIVFRPSVIGKALDQYVGYDDEVMLKIGTYHGPAITGTSIIGLFNTTPRPLTELLHLSRFPGTVSTQPYTIRSHISRRVTQPLTTTDPTSLVSMSLAVRGYDILTAYPLRGFVPQSGSEEDSGPVSGSGSSGSAAVLDMKSGSHTTWLAVLGLVGKMAAGATIVQSTMIMDARGVVTIKMTLKALGTAGIYAYRDTQEPSHKEVWDLERILVLLKGVAVPVGCVSVRDGNGDVAAGADGENDGEGSVVGSVLEVDTEKAWVELGLQAGWEDVVEVTVIVPLL